MDNDAATLETALGLLRDQFGPRLVGPMRRAQVDMRKALEMKLAIDELTADRVVKKLCETGRLVYVGLDESDESGSTAVGPVAGIRETNTPVSGGPLGTVTAFGNATDPVGRGLAGDMRRLEAEVVAAQTAPQDPTDTWTSAALKIQENREGATMGQLGDTAIEAGGPPGDQQALADDTRGHWIIQ